MDRLEELKRFENTLPKFISEKINEKMIEIGEIKIGDWIEFGNQYTHAIEKEKILAFGCDYDYDDKPFIFIKTNKTPRRFLSEIDYTQSIKKSVTL